MTTFKTAKEAFEQWQLDDRYLDDTDGGATDPEVAYDHAYQVITMAKAEGLKLEELVPDAEVRKNLESQAEEHEFMLKHY